MTVPAADLTGISAAIIVASTRAATGSRPDAHAEELSRTLGELGLDVHPARIVADGDPVGAAIRDALDTGARVILTTGGTGLTPDDTTPEQTRAVIDREVPGITEAIRAKGFAAVPTALLSRAVCGVAGNAVVLNMPGSRGGIKDSLAVFMPLLPHLLAQLDDDHEH